MLKLKTDKKPSIAIIYHVKVKVKPKNFTVKHGRTEGRRDGSKGKKQIWKFEIRKLEENHRGWVCFFSACRVSTVCMRQGYLMPRRQIRMCREFPVANKLTCLWISSLSACTVGASLRSGNPRACASLRAQVLGDGTR